MFAKRSDGSVDVLGARAYKQARVGQPELGTAEEVSGAGKALAGALDAAASGAGAA